MSTDHSIYTYSDSAVSAFRNEILAGENRLPSQICPWDALKEEAKTIWRTDYAKHMHKLSRPPQPPMHERDFILQQIDQLLKRLREITRPGEITKS
jgi:hypothetical protein